MQNIIEIKLVKKLKINLSMNCKVVWPNSKFKICMTKIIINKVNKIILTQQTKKQEHPLINNFNILKIHNTLKQQKEWDLKIISLIKVRNQMQKINKQY